MISRLCHSTQVKLPALLQAAAHIKFKPSFFSTAPMPSFQPFKEKVSSAPASNFLAVNKTAQKQLSPLYKAIYDFVLKTLEDPKCGHVKILVPMSFKAFLDDLIVDMEGKNFELNTHQSEKEPGVYLVYTHPSIDKEDTTSFDEYKELKLPSSATLLKKSSYRSEPVWSSKESSSYEPKPVWSSKT